MGLFAYPYKMAANLIVSGEDAADFLQSQFSNDLRPFSVGQCTYGLWLDVKGKILADSWVRCGGEERFRIFSEHCEGPTIKDKLEQHIIADDVELELGQPVEALALIGEDASELCSDLDEKLWGFPGRRSNMPSHELIFPEELSRKAWIRGHDCEIVSKSWLQNERMKAGISLVGAEVLPGDLPAEAGLIREAISFNKGCFLGQEVVARMHNIGRPQRRLFKLSGSGAPPTVPSTVTDDAGKLLGDLRTSIAVSTGWAGVAMLKTRYVEFGKQLSLGDGLANVDNFYAKED